MSWTPQQIPDLSGLVALVTGANTGLGLRTSLELARHGATVTMTSRDPAKGAEALAAVRREVPRARVEAAALDVADLASVRALAGSWSGPLDLLVNNAGVMLVPFGLTADGFETHIGVNHLGPFALTGLLLPALRRSPAARVVAISSVGHRGAHLDVDSFTGEGRYRSWAAYGQSKLANLLFTRHLSARLVAGGESTLAVAAHPGISRTELTRHVSGRSALAAAVTTGALRVVATSGERGAWPQLYAATMPDVAPGGYYGPSVAGTRGSVGRVKPSADARDDAVAAVLWERSEELTGVRYPDLAPAPPPG